MTYLYSHSSIIQLGRWLINLLGSCIDFAWSLPLSVRVTFFWVVMQALAVTVLLHRSLTHRAVDLSDRATRFWLWWARSGLVKFYEWVINHLWHHVHSDTDRDTHTPWHTNANTGKPPLVSPFPKFWRNASAYTATSVYLREHPNELQELRKVRWAREALDHLEPLRIKYEAKYCRLRRAVVWNLSVFYVCALYDAVAWFGVVRGVFVAWVIAGAMFGIVAMVYVFVGQVINYYGHQADDPIRRQSNIPWWLMLLTLAVMGEGWHRFHHDAMHSARLNRFFDPGWWSILLMKWTRQAKNIRVAVRVPNQPRTYRYRVIARR